MEIFARFWRRTRIRSFCPRWRSITRSNSLLSRRVRVIDKYIECRRTVLIQIIVSEYNRLENGAYVDYGNAKSFEYDHINNKPTSWEDYPVDSEISSTM